MTLTGANVPITQLTSASALRLLRNLLTLPYLAFVPIHPESFNTRRTSEVSTQLIISQVLGGKEFITDNSAPGPRIWTLKGYISGIPFIELSNWFMPSLLIQKLIIDNAHTSRKAVPFRTTDGELVSVLIKECNFIEEPDNMNTLHIEVTLQELNYLTVTSSLNVVSSTDKGLAKSLPLIGKSLGKAFAVGGTALGFTVAGVGLLLEDTGSVSGATIVEANPTIPAEDAATLAAATSLMSQDQVLHIDTMTIIPLPPIPDLTESFSFSVVLPLGTVYFTFVFIDSKWNITTTLNESVVTYILTPNILLNPLASDFSLFFVSGQEEIGLEDLALANMVLIAW